MSPENKLPQRISFKMIILLNLLLIRSFNLAANMFYQNFFFSTLMYPLVQNTIGSHYTNIEDNHSWNKESCLY